MQLHLLGPNRLKVAFIRNKVVIMMHEIQFARKKKKLIMRYEVTIVRKVKHTKSDYEIKLQYQYIQWRL